MSHIRPDLRAPKVSVLYWTPQLHELLYDRHMIVVSNRIQVAEGYEKEFESRFEGRARLVEKHKGFVRLEILRPKKIQLHGSDQGGSQYYVVLTYWQTAEDFAGWTASDAFREAHSNRPPKEMFAGPNVFEMHEIIQLVEAKSEDS